MRFVSQNVEETAKIAKDFVEKIVSNSSRATVFGLVGELGSGKTTFTQAVGSALGITEKIQSPTFVIQKIYKVEKNGFEKFIHIDAYRLETEEEIHILGWDELIQNPKNLILIEWPERIGEKLPSFAKKISFKHFGGGGKETEREIVFQD